MISFHSLILCSVLLTAAAPDGLSVSGQVLDAKGYPVAEAEALLLPLPANYESNLALLAGRTAPAPLTTARTLQEGRFLLEVPTAGVYRVEVRAAGYVPVQYTLVPLVRDVELPPVTLTEDVGAEVAVLRKSDDTALAGIWVSATSSSDGPRQPLSKEDQAHGWRPVPRLGRSDEDGTLRWPRAAGEWLDVTLFLPWAVTPQRVLGVEGLRYFVTPERVVRHPVAVRTEGGAPRPDVVVATGREGWPVALTDAEGRVSLPGPFDQPRWLHLLTAEGGRHLVQLPPGEPPEQITLPPAATLTGQVTDGEGGPPLPGVLVWRGDDPGAYVLTDAEGGYRMPADDRVGFWLQAEAAGFLPCRLSLEAGRREAPVLPLEREGVLNGQVVGGDGRGLPGVMVTATLAPGAPRRQAFRLDRADGRAVTGADGRFRMAPLRSSSAHLLEVSRRGYKTASLTVAAVAAHPEPVRIVLESAVRAFGRVVDLDEVPVAGAEVRASSPHEERPSHPRDDPFLALSDEDGRFELLTLPAPPVDLAVRRSGFAPLVARGVVPEGKAAPEEGTALDLGTLVLEPGATLEGRVTDPGGVALGEVSVWQTRDELRGSALAALKYAEPAAVSAEDGRFLLTDLTPGETLNLVLARRGFLPATHLGAEVPPDAPLEIVLEPAATLGGRVVDEEERPIAGAAVSLRPGELPEGVLEVATVTQQTEQVAETDSEGLFSFDAVAPGHYEAEAFAEGFQTSPEKSLEVAKEEEEEPLVFVLKRGAVLRGRVLDSHDEPVAGAQVMVGRPSGRSDAEGYYRVAGVPPGKQTVEARHPKLERAVRVVDIEPGDNELDIVLEAGYPVTGWVLAEDGTPVEEVAVTLEGGREFRAYDARSDADGRFHFSTVARGEYRIRAAKPGYATLEKEGPRVDGAGVEGLEVVLAAGVTLSGNVLGLSFEELEQLQVAIRREGGGGTRQGRVDYQGRFEIRDLGVGRWQLRAVLAGGRREVMAWVSIEPGVRQVRRDLEFRPGRVLTGRILHDGVALPGCRIDLSGHDLEVSRQVLSDQRGGFRVEDLLPGPYRLEASCPRELLVESRDLEIREDLDLVIEITSAAVSGQVSAGDGRPLADVLVSLRRQLSPADGGSGGGEGGLYTVGTDSEGRYRLSRLPVGLYRLSLQKDGYARKQQRLDVTGPIEGLDWVLEPTAGLTLRVRTLSPALPPYVTVHATDGEGNPVLLESRPLDVEGRAVFPTLPPGTWELLIGAPGATTVEVTANVPGEPLDLLLPAGAGLEVRVPVLEAETNALAAAVSLFDPQGQPFWGLDDDAPRQTWPLRGGRARLEGVPAGHWLVEVTTADGRRWSGSASTDGIREVLVVLE